MKKYAVTIIWLGLSVSAFSLGQPEPMEFQEPLIMVINYPYQIWSEDPSKIHSTFFMADFKPASGAEIFVDGQYMGRANADGVLIFDLVAGNNSSHLLKARLKANGKVYGVDKSFSSNARTESFRVERVFVYTDRGVYHPGQEIFLRVLAWELTGEYQPLADSDVEIYFQNRQGRIFCGEKLVTDDFGVAHSRISVPPHLPEGDYELVVLHGEAREVAELRVEPFRAPAIRISHDLKRYLSTLQKECSFNVDLSYFTGGKPERGTLELRIQSPSGDVLFTKLVSFEEPSVQVALSGDDLISIKSTLPEESAFKLALTVTDQFGQSSEVLWDMQYTAKPFRVVLELDKDSYLHGEEVQVLAKVVDLDGQPAADLSVVLQIEAIELTKSFKTNASGVALLNFTMPNQAVNVVVTNPDTGPILAQRNIPFQAFKPLVSKVNKPPDNSKASVVIRAEVHEDYLPVEKVIHVDLTDVSGALVFSTTIKLLEDGGRWIARGAITPPTWGSMLVNLYVCAVPLARAREPWSVETVGFMTEGQHVTFYPDKEIGFVLSPVKAIYEPGEAVSVKVRLENATKEAQVGVSLVDEAVLSLKDPLVKKPYSHFYNPQVKVLSTGGAGVLTWPVVDRNWGSPWRDIAYTDWGWKSPGALVDSGPFQSEGGAGSDAPMAVESEEMMDDSMALMEPEEAAKSMAKEESPAPLTAMDGDIETKSQDSVDDNRDQQKRDEGRSAEPGSEIVIRTEFPETSFWEPAWIVKNGQGELEFSLPDEMTSQQLTLVASDKFGGLGVYKQSFLVSQAAFIRSAFPAELTFGDRIWAPALVRNLGDKALSLKALLLTQDFDILSEPEITLELAPGESQKVRWLISVNSLGNKSYALRILGKGAKDQENRTLMVRPAGVPQLESFSGEVTKGQDFQQTLQKRQGSVYRSVNLTIGLPNIIPAIQAWGYYENYPWYSPWSAASAALMNQALLKLARSNNQLELVEKINFQLQRAMGLLVSRQNSDGSWGWYSGNQSKGSVYLTLNSLRALAKIHEAGLPVSSLVFEKAIAYLMSQRKAQGLWDSKTAYFWDSFNETVDYTLSAEIFEVIMCVGLLDVPLELDKKQLDSVKNKLEAYDKESSGEAMFYVSWAQGLSYYHELFSRTGAQKDVHNLIQSLLRLKRGSYWEPHWYHAYGGMVELNSRVLLLLTQNNDDHQYDGFIREVLAWLLSTRESWGAWHNEWGTARAIEALAASGLMFNEKPSEVILFIDDQVVFRKKIDPADPFLSAASLRFIDLTPYVKPDSKVKVRYTGDLLAFYELEVRDWGPSVVANEITVERSLSSELELSRSYRIGIHLKGKKALGPLVIHEKIPSLLHYDLESLEDLLNRKIITAYEIQGQSLWISLISDQLEYQLEYLARAVYQGQSEFQPIEITEMSSGRLIGLSDRNKLEVN